ncbi:hypothetical protein Ancab_034265 [Ancistrocladus abbreviatus]
MRRAAIVAQCGWRRQVARKELRKLKMAAKESAALQAAKTKLEEEVKELAWQLEEEKRLRADMEKAKTQENAKLQQALKEMEIEFEETKTQMEIKFQETKAQMEIEFQETKAVLSQQLEAAKKAVEQCPVVPIVDQELINKLTTENEQLKVLLTQEREAAQKALEATPAKEAHDTQEVTVVDQELTKKLTAEIEQLKVLLDHEREAAKKASNQISEEVCIMQEVPFTQEANVVNQELMTKLTAEIEQLKFLLDQERETAKKATDQIPAKALPVPQEFPLTEEGRDTQEVIVVDQELMKKLTAENEQLKFLLNQERQTTRKAAEQTPVMEVPTTQEIEADQEFINKITIENQQLKALVSSLENKISETEKKYEETNKISEERLKQALEAESKIIELKTTMQRLEERISDMETEDQFLRQQALLKSSTRKITDDLPLENGQHSSVTNKETPAATPRKSFGSESFRKSQVERQRESINILINCVAEDIGFSQGKPVAAFTIYKCLLHWKLFETERTNVFDCLIQLIGSEIEKEDDNNHLAYWFSNSSTLLFLLQRSLKSNGATGGNAQKPPQPTSFFGRMAQGFRSSANLPVDIVRSVEAKYPALLFKQQLTAYVEKIYGIIRENLKSELSPLLSSCIQGPKTVEGTVSQSSEQSESSSPPPNDWKRIINSLNGLLSILKDNFVPPVLVPKFFCEIFSYINMQLFNSLLLHQECCTFSNGEYIKAGLAELEKWCGQAAEEYAGSSWDELKHIRQAVGFLVVQEKSNITYDDITNNLCPSLSVHQVYRMCTLLPDDNDETLKVNPDVISNMKALMTDDTEEVSDANNSFVLEDNSSIPFSVDDITNSMSERDFVGIKPPPQLLENAAFQFLQD